MADLSLGPAPTDEELNRRLEEKLNVFRNAGLRLRRLITIDDFLVNLDTFEDAVKLLRFLESFVTQGILLPLISQAEQDAVLLAEASLGAANLCDVADWLKTPEGSLVIRKLQTERKLLKKAAVQRSARDIAYTRLLSRQQADLSYELKEIRTQIELQIDELNEQIEQLKDKAEKEEAKIKDEYSAAANFADPSIKRLQDLCWARYLDKCTADGSAPIRWTNDALKMATEEYRREVSQTIVVEYCDDEKVRRQLAAYGKRKIKFLKTGKRKRELERFRNIFAIAAGAAADEGDSDGEEFESSVTPKGFRREKKSTAWESLGDG